MSNFQMGRRCLLDVEIAEIAVMAVTAEMAEMALIDPFVYKAPYKYLFLRFEMRKKSIILSYNK